MAYIADDDKQLQDPNSPQGQQQQQTGGGGPTTVGQGGSNDVGSSTSTAGVGAGGTGGWTNIQAYLNANKGDTGSAQALSKTVGDQFNQEKNAYNTDSQKFLQGAQDKVNADKIDTGQADNLINHAKDSYSWTGGQNDAYNQDVSKVQKSLTGTYQGPTTYNYGLSNQTQEYGNDLKDQTGGFDQIMNHIYQNAAPVPLSSGQLQLQKQLDVNNSNLVDARNNLANQYDQLGADRDKVVADTTSGLGGLEQQYRTNQNSLKDYLTRESNDYDTKVAQEQADARAAYQNTFATGQSGHAGAFVFPGSGNYYANVPLNNYGIGGDNLTWKQLQNENTIGTSPYAGDEVASELSANLNGNRLNGQTATAPIVGQVHQNYLNNTDYLNRFYGDQDKKYQNTADPEARSYNAIQDFLNTANARKSQGFKVRG